MGSAWGTVIEGSRQLWRTRREHDAPVGAQLAELLLFRRVSRMSRSEFYLYRLWRAGVPLADRLTFTSLRERLITDPRLNPLPWRAVCASKTAGAALLRGAGLNVPECLGMIGAGPLPDCGGAPAIRSAADLASVAKDAGPAGLIVKPDDGMQGRSVISIAWTGSREVVDVAGTVHDIDQLWEELRRPPARMWRLERRVMAHPALARMSAGGTPTLRMLALFVHGTPFMHAVTLRLPCRGSAVDNFSAGNYAAPVDPATGRIGPAVRRDFDGVFEKHPDTGATVAGLTLPGWPAARDAIVEAMPRLTPLSALGWDVALTDNGPVVLEINDYWGAYAVQRPHDRGILFGALIELLEEAGGAGILARRERLMPGWTARARSRAGYPG